MRWVPIIPDIGPRCNFGADYPHSGFLSTFDIKKSEAKSRFAGQKKHDRL
jgi:hypothetical protein